MAPPSWCLTDPVTIHFPLATKGGYNQSVGLDDQIILTVGNIVDRPSKPEHAGAPGYADFLAIRWNPPKASIIIFFQSRMQPLFFMSVAKRLGLHERVVNSIDFKSTTSSRRFFIVRTSKRWHFRQIHVFCIALGTLNSRCIFYDLGTH